MPLPIEVAKPTARGPRRLEYVPSFAREIPGIEHVTTVAQLHKLKAYIDVPQEKRKPFVRLGCSVSHTSSEPDAQNSTWVVTCNGNAKVLRRNGDPRRAHRWFQNAARPWNIERNFASDELTDEKTSGGGFSAFSNYIVTVAVDEISDDMTVPELQPDGQVIASTRYRILSASENLVEVLVNAVDGWWTDKKFDGLLFNLREASGEIFANEDGAVWVSFRESVSFPALGFADTEAMADRRAPAPDLLLFLNARARQYLISRIDPYGRLVDTGTAYKIIDEALADQDLCNITLPGMDMLLRIIQLRLSREAA